MSTETTNLKLQKPDGEDYVDISVINSNMDKLDTAVGGKASLSLDNVTLPTEYAGKALIVTEDGGVEFGEAGKVDDVKVNGTSVITNKVADISVPTSVDGLSGGTITSAVTVSGHITGQYVTGTWLRTSSATNLNSVPSEYPVLSSGWIYKRTRAQMRTDLEIPTKVTELSDAGNYALKSDLADAGDKHTISDTAPESPHDGDIWFDTSNQGSTPTGLSRYLPLYGGTITGSLEVSGTLTNAGHQLVTLDTEQTISGFKRFVGGIGSTGGYNVVDTNGNIKAYLGYDANNKNLYITNTDGPVYLFATNHDVHVQSPSVNSDSSTVVNKDWIWQTGANADNGLMHRTGHEVKTGNIELDNASLLIDSPQTWSSTANFDGKGIAFRDVKGTQLISLYPGVVNGNVVLRIGYRQSNGNFAHGTVTIG